MKLRLLLWEECNRKCPECCNKEWDLKALPKCDDFSPFKTVMLTGGEPMLRPRMVRNVARDIRFQSPTAKIYLYTAKVDDVAETLSTLYVIDGLTLTLHEQKDVRPFLKLIRHLPAWNLSLRLNIFKGVNINNKHIYGWKVKSEMEWVKDCPLPEGEVFMRYQHL